MSAHPSFPNNNGHNVSDDFLDLTLSLGSRWSSSLASNSPLLSEPSSSSTPSNLSSPFSPPPNPYELNPTLYQAIGGPSYYQSVQVGGPSHQGNTSIGDPSSHQHTNKRRASGAPTQNKRRRRRSILKPGQSETVTPPYPWATEYRAIIHDLQHIQSKGIKTITGTVKCTQCNGEFEIDYNLRKKFKEVQHYVIANQNEMWQRAPDVWRSPAQLDCRLCDRKKCVKPILGKKRSINWLFLFLGQMIGFCKHTELKFFCKHTFHHKTGAKDRVLYLTYMELCRQLDPQGYYVP